MPFFPYFLREKDLPAEILGYMMSVFAASFICSALVTGKYVLMRINRTTGCFLGAVFIIINIIGLGLLFPLKNSTIIITLCIIVQIIGGIGNGLLTTSTLAIISGYKEDRQTYIGYFEIVSGLGTMLGPNVGSLFYSAFNDDFQAPFFGIASIFAFVIIYFKYIKGEAVRVSDEEQILRVRSGSYVGLDSSEPVEMGNVQSGVDNIASNSLLEVSLRKLTFCDILKAKRCLFGLIVQFLVYFIMSFNTPILNTHLDSLGYTPSFISATIAAVALTYAISIPFVLILVKKIQKRGVLFIGLSLSLTGTLITGVEHPSNDRITSALVIFGCTIFGMGLSFTTIPVMPEVLEGIENYYSNIDDKAL